MQALCPCPYWGTGRRDHSRTRPPSSAVWREEEGGVERGQGVQGEEGGVVGGCRGRGEERAERVGREEICTPFMVPLVVS